jgi:uncharacterized protein YbjQ (UPF0145 family)
MIFSRKKWFLLLIAIVLIAIVSSCASVPKNDYAFPQAGSVNSARLAVKDYQSLGVIFVNSTETIDGNGNHTGSKITYEMLMREAIKLGADDVINIKIDVNEIQEVVLASDGGGKVMKTTYNYTANALAIKYTDAIQGGVSAVIGSDPLAEVQSLQVPPEEPADPYNLDNKNIVAVSAAASYGKGWTAGGTVTVYEKHKPDAFFVPSIFITAKYLEDPYDGDNTYWHPRLFTGGLGVSLKHVLKSNKRFVFSGGVSFEYFTGSVSHFKNDPKHVFGDNNSNRHVENFSRPGIGVQAGISYRITPNISLDLNGMGKFAFGRMNCNQQDQNFGFYSTSMGGAELGVTFSLPY